MSKSNRSKSTTLIGTIKRHPDGFGFLIPEDPEAVDVYVPRHEMTGIMGNDRVEVEVTREHGGDRFRGQIRKVLGRGNRRVTGKYERSGQYGYLRDHSFSWGTDLQIRDEAGHVIKDGNWVSVDILTYPDSPQGFTGKVVAVIGDIAVAANDSLRILHVHSIPDQFSKAAQQEAARIPSEVTEAQWRGRKDMRQLKFITIDGRTAKDFDDAILVEKTSSGFKLWVAIADVSHYVKPGSAIDRDAYERGTSTYFPNFVSPMLPEKLSNELCSLKPKVPRLAFVAEMDLDFQGQLMEWQIYEAVICSQARVTYGEAQEVIDGQNVKELAHVTDMIRRASDLAKILMAKRFREGSLDLEIPETEIEVDDSGEPVDVLQTERLFAHRLIEELMLMANITVAKELNRRQVAGLFRVHDEPNPEAIRNLESYLGVLGSQRKLHGGGLQKKITRALEDFADHPQEHILHILTLRSMAQAHYSSGNIGHFGLGFSDYAHFTSPIRRYPDLMVHRQLKAALGIGDGYELLSAGDLESAGVFLSSCEQRSVKAERQIKAIKKARFMHRHLGQEFEGVVSSVTKFGLFVILRQFDIDGLVRLETLQNDRFEFDEKNMRLVGRKSGQAIRIGDLMRVIVATANIEEGRIDFVPAGFDEAKSRTREEKPRADRPQAKSQPFKKRRPAKNNSRRVRSTRFSSSRRKG